jgi:hypothetical protein
MARIKLTKPWRRAPKGAVPDYVARWKSTRLEVLKYESLPRFQGYVKLRPGRAKLGPRRKSVAQAKRDAERFAVELVEDLARYVGPYLAQFGMEVEDDG